MLRYVYPWDGFNIFFFRIKNIRKQHNTKEWHRRMWNYKEWVRSKLWSLQCRHNQIQEKRIIVFAMSEPYALDATDISKLSAYYALFSRSSSFIEIAASLGIADSILIIYLLFYMILIIGLKVTEGRFQSRKRTRIRMSITHRLVLPPDLHAF